MGLAMRHFLVALGVMFGTSACGAGHDSTKPSPLEPASNAIFEQMVREKLPGLQLTPARIGKSFTIPNAYSIAGTNDVLPPKEQAVSFMRRYEAQGVAPVTLFVRQDSRKGTAYWKLEFPGCAPGSCSSTIDTSKLSKASQRQYERYHPSLPGRLFEGEIATAKIEYLHYRAELQAVFNNKNELLTYYVKVQRSARNERERNWIARYRRGNSTSLLFFMYSAIPAFGTEV